MANNYVGFSNLYCVCCHEWIVCHGNTRRPFGDNGIFAEYVRRAHASVASETVVLGGLRIYNICSIVVRECGIFSFIR